MVPAPQVQKTGTDAQAQRMTITAPGNLLKIKVAT
jgi:hypothetical protein